jgi:hypothetical protein
MPNGLLIDEIHVTVYVPRRLPEPPVEAALRVLKGRPFRATLRHAVHAVFGRHPALDRARVRTSR